MYADCIVAKVEENIIRPTSAIYGVKDKILNSTLFWHSIQGPVGFHLALTLTMSLPPCALSSDPIS